MSSFPLSPTADKIIKTLKAHNHDFLTISELSKLTNLSYNTIRRAVFKLKSQNLLIEKKGHMGKLFCLSLEMENLLSNKNEAKDDCEEFEPNRLRPDHPLGFLLEEIR
ncbi:MAG: HTH domain-containing protein [Candidatus Heimdallarchaeota archaeon]|nr:HTH domain-containing protein [Candidatus Heimdallarchaeota archaeon]MCK5048085.1 HTH domain-containing protein [Candidatus Heimdallarchaeota archaeon]